MTSLLPISTALCLPAADITALIHGRIIAAMPRIFIRPGQKFALYPVDALAIPIPIDKYYCSNFLPVAQSIIKKSQIQAYAQCEFSQIIDDNQSLEKVSRLTIWTQEALDKILYKQQHIFLSYLRVYKLYQPYELSLKIESNKLGKYIGLPNSLTASNTIPVLPDNIFNTRKRQLEKLESPAHPELENLLDALSPLAIKNPAAKQFQENIHLFLGWSNQKQAKHFDSDLVWINKIAEVGNSSDGNEFERLTRKSFIKLGFSCSNTNSNANLDPEKLGGAGGLDFYCEYPYPVVGECKATKTEKVPDGVAAQLIKLGYKHLQKHFDSCVKIILAAGELTKHAILTAQNNHMNVITPETLEKLVELQSHYQGCVNLLELKQCLQQEPFGLADDKVNSYIRKIEQDIKLRSHLVELVKYYLQNSNLESTGVEALHGAYFGSQPPRQLNIKEMHEILIELSSSLTGYLGRIKGADWKSDKFYFLRDLPS
ncbi:hypothetical protein Riv7116_1493 [Rivularia sp. PCC 7116]|uniref:DUF1802 family protein n=1 Tax=Rivularia sp. PCC 7116 TaxID=373994 RepID=UPI00029F1FEF|nr:DUF1802 family protein [Rivularia sp. PCC 7116]AFY54053.1 hypothetical protein Riv7116_1493 [Rivularia sp. PCC 7116]